jgi:ketosteroid isomerase-like protein
MASQHGVQIVVFSSAGEATPSGEAGFVSASGGTWEMAATKAVLEINELQLQHGHLGHKHGHLRAPKGINI